MRKILILAFAIFSMQTMLLAQDSDILEISGVVLDKESNEAVAFANLGIVGTVSGVASDIDGMFSLKVSATYASLKLKVSAIGYKSYEISLKEACEQKDLKILLEPVTYSINEVNILGKAQVCKRIIRDVVNNISKNYICTPYNYKAYFKEESRMNSAVKLKDAIITLYDGKGYSRNNVSDDYKSINYKVNESRISTSEQFVKDGFYHIDDVLVNDIVRHTRNILDVDNLDYFELKEKGKIIHEGHNVQIISYKLKTPNIAFCGEAYAEEYYGELYVDLTDNAIIKNEVNIKSKQSPISRSLMASPDKLLTDVVSKISTNYKKLNGVYFLSGIKYTQNYTKNNVKYNTERMLIVTKVNKNNPEQINSRVYYNDIDENKQFWSGYTAYFEGF